MLTVGREAIVLRDYRRWDREYWVVVRHRFQKWKQLYSCDRNSPEDMPPRALFSIAFGVCFRAGHHAGRFFLRLYDIFTDINAGPF